MVLKCVSASAVSLLRGVVPTFPPLPPITLSMEMSRFCYTLTQATWQGLELVHISA
jgi:hypothetical protein